MGLILPPGPGFGYANSNLTGTPVTNTPGTNFTFGASNADGTAVGLGVTAAEDLVYVVLGIGGCATTAEDNSALLDLMTDPAGGTSYGSFIDNLACGFSSAPTGGTIGITCWYHFPIWVPAGSSFAVRARKNGATAATGGRAVLFVYGAPKRQEMWWYGTKVEALGIDEANSKGAAHTPGNTGTFSSYATVGTSTRHYGALQFMVNGSDAGMTAVAYHWQLGIGSAQMPGTPTFYHMNATTEVMQRCGFNQPLFVNVPPSTAVQVRATASGTAEAHNVAVYGVY